MAKGAGWLILLRVAERGLGFISTLVLVRLLLPDDFGLVAMAMSLVAMVEVLGSFGLDMALIQNQTADHSHFDTVWTVYVLYGAASCVLLCLAAGPTSSLYGEPRLEAIIYALAGIAIIQGFENIGIVAFQKEMRFNKEFQFRVAKKLVGFIVTITLAATIKNYWALVIGSGLSRVFGVGISYFMHPFRPRFSLVRIKDLWRFSFWMWLNNAVVFSATRGYDFIVGKISGPRGLGLYTVAYEIATLPTTELVDPISRAIFPGLSSLASNRLLLRRAVIQSASIVALLTLPLGAGIAVLSEPFVWLVLGKKWSGTIPIISILGIYGIMRAAHASSGAAYNAIGHPRIITLVNLPHLLIGWPLMIFALHAFGIVSAAYVIICASFIGLLINYNFATRLLDVRGMDIFHYYWRPAIASALMVAADLIALHIWPPQRNTSFLVLQMSIYVALGAIIFLVSVVALWIMAGRPSGAEEIFLNWARSRRQLHKRASPQKS